MPERIAPIDRAGSSWLWLPNERISLLVLTLNDDARADQKNVHGSLGILALFLVLAKDGEQGAAVGDGDIFIQLPNGQVGFLDGEPFVGRRLRPGDLVHLSERDDARLHVQRDVFTVGADESSQIENETGFGVRNLRIALGLFGLSPAGDVRDLFAD